MLAARLWGQTDGDAPPAFTVTLSTCGRVHRGLIYAQDRPALQVHREEGLTVVPKPPSQHPQTQHCSPCTLGERAEPAPHNVAVGGCAQHCPPGLQGSWFEGSETLGEEEGAPVYTAFP